MSEYTVVFLFKRFFNWEAFAFTEQFKLTLREGIQVYLFGIWTNLVDGSIVERELRVSATVSRFGYYLQIAHPTYFSLRPCLTSVEDPKRPDHVESDDLID